MCCMSILDLVWMIFQPPPPQKNFLNVDFLLKIYVAQSFFHKKKSFQDIFDSLIFNINTYAHD